MRKFLSLVLALVMMMSLVTINAGAKEFTDADDITYVEAVDVISTINVMDGYEGGGFSPAGNLTRGAAAKIICNLILGPTTAAELHADTAPYRDVPVNHTFAGYIAYCQKEGIVSGYADGTFRPAGTLTGYAFMKMLLGALGYDAEIEGYVGPNWSINVAKKAISIGLNKSLVDTFNGVDYITREEAALYAFNTLKADLVEYDQKITATVNGAAVTVGSSNAKPQEWDSQQTRRNNIYDDSIVQFAEQYFNKLVLTQDVDVFGRPDREWKFDGEDIGAYINYDLLKEEYTAKVTGKDLRDLLGASVVDEKDGYKFNITIDGETEKTVLNNYGYFTQGNLVRTNTEGVGNTGNGVLTQVFVDSDKEIVWIAIINTYLAKATADYNEKKGEATFDTWDVKWFDSSKNELVKDRSINTPVSLTVSDEDFEFIKDVKEDDIVLVHVADGEIQEFVDPEVIDSTEISAFKNGDWVNAEGTQYDYAHTAKYDTEVLDEYDDNNMKDTTYRIYLDEYGYLIGIEIIEEPNQYLFLTGLDTSAYNLGNKRAEANVIFIDGTSDTVTVNLEKSKACKQDTYTPADNANQAEPYEAFKQASLWNTWCTYSVDENGVYTLTEVANTNAQLRHNDAGNAWNGTKRAVDKVGQGHTTTAVNTAGKDVAAFVIDTKRIGLDGIQTPGYTTVYGNDDTVYLTASLKKITDAKGFTRGTIANGVTGTEAIIIDGVDSVTTGVRNASLDVYSLNTIKTMDSGAYAINFTNSNTDTVTNDVLGTGNGGVVNTSHGAYALFNDKGFVIAAVVVGDDNGTTSNYAYAYGDWSDAKGAIIEESYSKETKNWTWKAQAIVNGEDVVLTEVTDKLAELSKMSPNNWYEVKYKADGTVKSVQPISTNDPDLTTVVHPDYTFCLSTLPVNATHIPPAAKYPKFVGKIELVQQSNVDNDGKLLLFEDLWGNAASGSNANPQTYILKAEGNSLQVQNATNPSVSKGFSVAPSAKVWLIQDVKPTNANLKRMDDVQLAGEGQNGLKAAISWLNGVNVLNPGDDVVKFRGYVSAQFENGMATSVIIYERNATVIDQGNETTVFDGQVLGVMDDVATVNEALLDGNVLIPGNWTPRAGGTLRIPMGRTLRIEGDFNAVEGAINGDAVSVDKIYTTGTNPTLNVTGLYTMNYNVSSQVNYNITAGAMAVLLESNSYANNHSVRINSNVVLNGDAANVPYGLLIQDSTTETLPTPEVIVSSTGNVNVKDRGVSTMNTSDVITAVDDVWMQIDGTMTIGNNSDYMGSVKVTSLHSLHMGVRAVIWGKLVTDGGLVETGSVEGGIWQQGATDVIRLTNASNTTGGETKFMQVTAGGSISVAATTSATTTTTNVAVDAGTSDLSSTTPVDLAVVDTVPITAEMKFVYDKASWIPYGGKTWADFYTEGEGGGYSTLPWVFVLVSKAEGVESATVKGVRFEINGVETAVLDGGEVDNVWNIATDNTKKAFHWEMKKSTNAGVLSLDQNTVASGEYKVIFTVQVGSSEPVEVEAVGTWNGTVPAYNTQAPDSAPSGQSDDIPVEE